MLSSAFGKGPKNYGDVEFWHTPERSGWLMKQGEYIKTWRRRWFILKQGRIFWFKTEYVTPDSITQGVIEVDKCLSIKGVEDVVNKPHAFEISLDSAVDLPRVQDSIPRGVIEVDKCLSIKGAEDVVNKPHAFEISTHAESMFYIADTDKEKEDWINAVGRAIVRHSKSMLEHEQRDYTTG